MISDEVLIGIGYTTIILLFFTSTMLFIKNVSQQQIKKLNLEKTITILNGLQPTLHNLTITEACEYLQKRGEKMKITNGKITCTNLDDDEKTVEFPISFKEGSGRIILPI